MENFPINLVITKPCGETEVVTARDRRDYLSIICIAEFSGYEVRKLTIHGHQAPPEAYRVSDDAHEPGRSAANG